MAETSDNEPTTGTVVRQFRPHWRVLLAVGAWAVLALAGMIAAFAVGDLTTQMSWILVAVLLVGWIAIAAGDLISYLSTKYTLTTDQIIVKHGVLKITKTKIPLESIDNITMTRNVLERLLGYGDLTIESTQGSNVFSNIPDPEEFEAAVLQHRNALRDGGASASRAAAPAPRDAVQRLADLADLHDRGAVSDAEYEAKKARLLDEI